MRPKWLNALASLGTGAHHWFERRAGVGVFLEPWLGRRRTNQVWLTLVPLNVAQALRPTRATEPALAFSAGVSVAGMVVHFTEWPWSLRGGVLPWLDEAEGLPASKLFAYNSLLWAWGCAGVGSAVLETRPEHRRFVLAGLATGPLLLLSARHHFRWAAEQARLHPEDWSPELVA